MENSLIDNEAMSEKEKQELNYIVSYNNGYVMRQKRITPDYLTQIEIGVIRFIIILSSSEIWVKSEDGACKKIPLHCLNNP